MVRRKVLVSFETALRNREYKKFIETLDSVSKVPIPDRTFSIFIADFALASLGDNDSLFCLHSLLTRLEPSRPTATLLDLLEASCLEQLFSRCIDLPLSTARKFTKKPDNFNLEHDAAIPVLSCYRILEFFSLRSIKIKKRLLERIPDMLLLLGTNCFPSHVILGVAYLMNSLVQGDGRKESTEELVTNLLWIELRASGVVLDDLALIDKKVTSGFGVVKHILLGVGDFLTQLIFIETLFRIHLNLSSSPSQAGPFSTYLEHIMGSLYGKFLSIPPGYFVIEAPKFLKEFLRTETGIQGNTQDGKEENNSDQVTVCPFATAGITIAGNNFKTAIFATGVDSLCGIIQEEEKKGEEEEEEEREERERVKARKKKTGNESGKSTQRRGGLIRVPYVQCIRLQISRHDQAVAVKTTNVYGKDVPPELNNGVSTLQFWLPKSSEKFLSPPMDIVTPSATDANYNEEPTLAGKGRDGGDVGRGSAQELTIVFRFDDRTELETFRSKIAPEIIRVRSLYREHEKERVLEAQRLSQEQQGKQVSGLIETGKKDSNYSSKLNGVKMSLAFVDPLGLVQQTSNDVSISTQGKEIKTGQSSLAVTSTKGFDPTDTLPYAQRMTETEVETQNVIFATKKVTTENLDASASQLMVQNQRETISSESISKGKTGQGKSTAKKKTRKLSSATVGVNDEPAAKKGENKGKQMTETNISSSQSQSSLSSSSVSPSSSSSVEVRPQSKRGKNKDKNKNLESEISEDTITETSDDDPSYSLRTTTSSKRRARSINRIQTKRNSFLLNKKRAAKQQAGKPKKIVINIKKNNGKQDRDVDLQSSTSSATEIEQNPNIDNDSNLPERQSSFTGVGNNTNKQGEEMDENSLTPTGPSSESIIEKSRSVSKAKASPVTSSPIPEPLKNMAKNLSLPVYEGENKENKSQVQKQKQVDLKMSAHTQLPINKRGRRRAETDQGIFPSTKRAAPGLTQTLQRSNSLSPSLSNPALAIETAFGNLQAAVANQRRRLGEACARQSLSDIEEMTRIFAETSGSRLDALETGIKMRYEELTTQIRAESRQISSIFNDFIVAIEAAQKQHENTSQDIKEFIRVTSEEIKEAEKAQKAEAVKVRRRIEQAKKRWRRRMESAEEITAGVQRMREYIRSLDKMAEMK